MPYAVALAVLVALVLLVFVAVARQEPAGPGDVAVAYETAWDHHDFGLLYELSGPPLRDGLRPDAFVAAKRAAFAGRRHRTHIARHIGVERVTAGRDRALVVTCVATDEGAVRNDLVLERTSGGWVVTAYSLHRGSAASGPPA